MHKNIRPPSPSRQALAWRASLDLLCSNTQAGRRVAPLFAALVLGVFTAHRANAQSALTFDGDTGTAGVQDGGGTWDAGTTANWYNGTTDVVWPNNTSTAVFGAGTIGTYAVTVGTVNAGAITFNQGGYTLSGGTITLTPASAATGFVVTTNGGTDSLTSALAGTTGTIFTKTGSGVLITGSGISGGTAAAPTLGIVKGGTFSSATGIFDSVLQVPAGNFFGTAPTATTTAQITLDSGTLRFSQNGGNLLAASRAVQVNAAGGAIVDSGTIGASTNSNINGPIAFSAGTASTSLYLANASGATTTFSSTNVISGTGNVVWNGAGTALFQSTTSSYTGSTTVLGGVLATTSLAASGSNSGLGSGSAITLNGGTLRYTGAGGANANGGGFNRTITVGANGGTLDSSGTSFLAYSGSFAGSGTLTISGSNQLLYNGTSAGNFTGNIVVGSATANSGLVQYRSNNANAFGSGTITVNAGGTFTADSGTTTPTSLGNAFTLNGGLLATQSPNVTYSGTISLTATSSVGHTSNGTGTVTLSNAVSSTGNYGLNIVGGTTVTLSGASNYTGATTIGASTILALDNNNSTTARVSNSSGITVSAGTTTGGTLLLAQSGTTASTDRIGNAVPVTLAAGTAAGRGGIFNTGGLTEGPAGGVAGSAAAMGALTLQANSTINFTTGGSNLLFSSLTYTAGDAVRILNFTGATGADDGTAGNDRLLFTTDPGLSNAALAAIQFYSDAGTTAIGSGAPEIGFNGYFELVPIAPVPEPATWLAGCLFVGLAGMSQRRRIAGWRRFARC